MLETVPQSGIYELLSPDSMKEPALISVPPKVGNDPLLLGLMTASNIVFRGEAQ
jgi:hypothetical protein